MSRLHVVILGAGKGVRMRSELPKVLHRVAGRSLLERVIRASCALSQNSGPGGAEPQGSGLALAASVESVCVVVGNGRQAVEAEVAKLSQLDFARDIEFSCAVQENQNGTGDAVQAALREYQGNAEFILILPGDIPLVSREVLAAFVQSAQNSKSHLQVLSAVLPNPFGYGRILRVSSGEILAVVEEKDCSEEQRKICEVNTGIYLCRPESLRFALSKLTNNNRQKEFYLTDIVQILAEKGEPVSSSPVADFMAISGANSRRELMVLAEHQRLQRLAALAESGVTIQGPGNTFIDDDVVVEPDVFIGSGVRLYGSTRIGAGSVLDGDSLIRDSVLGQNVHVKLSCVIDQAQVFAGAKIGPFAHLRPGTELAEDVHIGNFVETKQTKIGAGSKANHLTYLGDAQVGSGVNVGAGTITCNYDGKSKHLTKIDSGASIGSNSSLVAPVTIGERAYVAAGSVITRDVPAEALGIERSEQVNREGWVKRRVYKEK